MSEEKPFGHFECVLTPPQEMLIISQLATPREQELGANSYGPLLLRVVIPADTQQKARYEELVGQPAIKAKRVADMLVTVTDEKEREFSVRFAYYRPDRALLDALVAHSIIGVSRKTFLAQELEQKNPGRFV